MYNKQIALRNIHYIHIIVLLLKHFFFCQILTYLAMSHSIGLQRTCIKIQTAVFAYEGSLDQVRKAKLLVTVCDEGPSWKGSPSIYEH